MANLFGLSTMQDLEEKKNYIFMLSQFINIIAVLFFLGLYLVVDFFFPNFYGIEISDFWLKSDNILQSLMAYKWLFISGMVFVIISLFALPQVIRPSTILYMDMGTSVGAGVVEELKYRCAYVFVVMLSIFFMDFLWKWIIIVIPAVIVLVVFYNLFKRASVVIWLTATAIALAIGIWLMFISNNAHPVYWFYQNIIFTIMSWVSFGVLDSILYNTAFPFLFIAGAITANAKFRDGHSYQGPVGYINSWIVGFVMIHIMMYHGLAVAIIAHTIYDLMFDVIRFTARKII